MIGRAKYLNENQALLNCKGHLTIELYLVEGVITLLYIELYLRHQGNLGKLVLDTLNHWLRYAESNLKYATPHFTSNELLIK